MYISNQIAPIAISTIFNLVKLSNFLAEASVAITITHCTQMLGVLTQQAKKEKTLAAYTISYTKKLEQVFRYI